MAGGLRRDRQFRLFWSAQVVSGFGSGVGGVALPLTAVVSLEASAMEMGFLTAAGQMPVLFLALHAGVLVDRLPRRPIMVVTNVGRGLLLAVIPSAALAGVLNIGLLWGVAFAVGALAVIFDLAVTSYPPTLVPAEQLVEANGALQAGGRAAQVVGPGAAGWLVRAVGAPTAVLVDASSFLVAALLLSRLRAPESRRMETRRVSAEIAEGIAAVWRDRVLRAMVGVTTLASFGGAVTQAVFVLFAVRHVGLSAPALGLVYAGGSIAGLAGSIAAGRISGRLGSGGAMIAGQAAGCLGALVLVAAPSGSVGSGIVALVQVLFTGGLAIFSVIQIALRQAITPSHLLGRVNATRRVTVFGIIPPGALLGGYLGSELGLRAPLLVAAGIQVVALAWIIVSPLRTASAHDHETEAVTVPTPDPPEPAGETPAG